MSALSDSTDVARDNSGYVPNIMWHPSLQAYDVSIELFAGEGRFSRSERIVTDNPQIIHREIEAFANANNAIVLEQHIVPSTVKPFYR